MCVKVCQITMANEDLCQIQDRFLRKVGYAHQHAKSGLCVRLLNCSEIFFEVLHFVRSFFVVVIRG